MCLWVSRQSHKKQKTQKNNSIQNAKINHVGFFNQVMGIRTGIDQAVLDTAIALSVPSAQQGFDYRYRKPEGKVLSAPREVEIRYT